MFPNLLQRLRKCTICHGMEKFCSIFQISGIQFLKEYWKKIQAQIVENDSSIFSDLSMITVYDGRISYCVLIEFHRYTVYDNEKNKRIYAIKSAYAMRIAGYRMNTYGVVPNSALPEIQIEAGRWTEFEYPIMQIELN